MAASAWTEDRIGRLKTLWTEGRTAEQIARELKNGISRSAVLGKVYRLGLSAGRTRNPPEAPAASPPRPRPAPARAVDRPRPTDRPAANGEAPNGAGVGLLAVRRGQCRWPFGDPRAAAFRLCGLKVERGAYCADHARVAYRPARDTPESLQKLVRLN